MSYELRALVGRYELVALAASEAGAAAVELPQGYGLLPITSGVSSRLGGDVRPFGDVFWFLSGAIEELARRISRAGAVAYLEAEIFGLRASGGLQRPLPSAPPLNPTAQPQARLRVNENGNLTVLLGSVALTAPPTP